MSAKNITFPVVSKGVRRNAETGIEIHNDSDGWYVKSFHSDKGDMFASYASQADAREAATADAKLMREQIAEAYDEAQAENAERDYQNTDMTEVEAHKAAVIAQVTDEGDALWRRQFPSVAAMVDAEDEIRARVEAEIGQLVGGSYQHAATSVEIVPLTFMGEPNGTFEIRVEGEDFEVHRSRGGEIDDEAYEVVGTASSLAEAYRIAKAKIAEIEDDAPLAADTDPEVAAEVAEANGLDAEDKVAMVAATVGVSAPAARNAERLGFRIRPYGTGVQWTHTLTGVMIGRFPGEAFAVTVPVNGAHVEVVAGFDEFSTFDAAVAHAMTLVVEWTRRIQADYAEALATIDAVVLDTIAGIPAIDRRGEVCTLIGKATHADNPHEA